MRVKNLYNFFLIYKISTILTEFQNDKTWIKG